MTHSSARSLSSSLEEALPRLCWPGKAVSEPEVVPAQLELIERHGPGQPSGNRLVAGDNLPVMAALLSEFEGRVDLIYLDPPFATGSDWAGRRAIGCHRGVTDGPAISQTAYSDVWQGGLSGYLDMLWPRLQLAYRLLSPTGTLFVHVGWQVNSHVRLLLDEQFGPSRLCDEIVWRYQTSGGAPAATLLKNHATLYRYAKGDTWTFNQIREPWPEATVRKWQRDEEGRLYRVQNRFGRRYYADPRGKRADDVWEATLASRSHERTRYPTQKPEALLERVVSLASHPGDLVADFFCGSGTTPAVANRLGRRWLACDAGVFAIQTTRRRLAERGASFDVIEAAGPAREWAIGLSPDQGPELRCRVERDSAHKAGCRVVLEDLRHPDRHAWPPEAQAACRVWDDAIEEWEVDWDHDGAVFRPGFATRRTRRDRSLTLESAPVQLPPGCYRVRVRAIDCFGAAAVWQADLQVP